jgi:hypothetical protein
MFDPTKPANHSPNSAAEMRAQLNALKALIDAVPAGPQGPAGSGDFLDSNRLGDDGFAGDACVGFGKCGREQCGYVIHYPGAGAGGERDVTNAIGSELVGTARNPNSVAMLSISISNPPTQAELQAVVDKVNELIGSLQR